MASYLEVQLLKNKISYKRRVMYGLVLFFFFLILYKNYLAAMPRIPVTQTESVSEISYVGYIQNPHGIVAFIKNKHHLTSVYVGMRFLQGVIQSISPTQIRLLKNNKKIIFKFVGDA